MAIAHRTIREHIPTLTKDRVMAPTMLGLIMNQELIERIEKRLGPLY